MEQKTERREIEEARQYYAALRRRILASMIMIPIIPFVLVLLNSEVKARRRCSPVRPTPVSRKLIAT